LDVSNREQSKLIAKTTLEKYGKIDILINNTGIIHDAFLSKMTDL
jgi:3-oxoacyl-[acyl-carrier protein] reductase